MLRRNGKEALLSTVDFQFTIKREAIKLVLPLTEFDPDIYYDPIYSPVLEKRLEANGSWQLSTPDYFIHHMGNEVPDLKKELPWYDWSKASEPDPGMTLVGNKWRPLNRILSMSPVRRVLHKVHTTSYEMLYDRNQ